MNSEASEDSQLTIRIPNPKVYMARQSLWIGRRGKPRCDYCRLNNLKCDRVLPSCNHCSWVVGRECKYTPLPTPAHRGIPRCDQCRIQNLKCDRNLPICNHCSEGRRGECVYTPKQRRKVPREQSAATASTSHGGAEGSSKVAQKLEQERHKNRGVSSESHPFYGQNVASASGILSKDARGRQDMADDLAPSPSSTSVASLPTLLHSEETHDDQGSEQASASPPYVTTAIPSFSKAVGSDTSHIQPWSHPSFAPLPAYITQRLRSITTAEMPDISVFNEMLTTFVDSLMVEIRETAVLNPDIYAALSRSLAGSDDLSLPTRMRQWSAFHHLCSGSDRVNLILAPRENIFQLDGATRESYRRDYCQLADQTGEPEMDIASESDWCSPFDAAERVTFFERLPVKNQIYDLLTYAHRSHGNVSSMLQDIKRIGFCSITWPMAELYTRLCPFCSLRDRTLGTPK